MAPMNKSKFLDESAGALGAVTGKRKWRARLISAGVSLNRKEYSAEMLQSSGAAAFPVGTHIHADHQSWEEWDQHPENTVKTIIGVVASEPVFEVGDDGKGGLYADVEIVEAWAPFVEQMAPYVGLSIHSKYIAEDLIRDDGVEVVQALIPSPLNTVDLVTVPGAGGKLLEAIESFRDTMGVDDNDNKDTDERMKPEDIEALATALVEPLARALKPEPEGSPDDVPTATDISEALIESKLPKAARESVYRRIESGEDLKEAISSETEYIKSLRESMTVEPPVGVFHASTKEQEKMNFTPGVWG